MTTVTWHLAPGVASALHELAEWREMSGRLSAAMAAVLTTGTTDPDTRPVLPGASYLPDPANPPARNGLRHPCRFTVPPALLARVEAEATAHGVPVERLVDGIAAAVLPGLLAAAVRDHLARSVQLTAAVDDAQARLDLGQADQ